MESKTKKSATKTTKTKEINSEITIKNQIDYTSILNKIYICLIVIAIILTLNLLVNIVKGGTTTSKTNNNQVEESVGEYDVSSFETLTTTEALEKIEKGGTEVIYIGRSTCGYCVKFLPILKQAQENLGYTTTYIDLEQVNTDDQAKLVALDSYVSDNFGYTPMVLVFKDGKYVNGWVGYAEYDEFASFLADAGIK